MCVRVCGHDVMRNPPTERKTNQFSGIVFAQLSQQVLWIFVQIFSHALNDDGNAGRAEGGKTEDVRESGWQFFRSHFTRTENVVVENYQSDFPEWKLFY